jgi:hypothetical protein
MVFRFPESPKPFALAGSLLKLITRYTGIQVWLTQSLEGHAFSDKSAKLLRRDCSGD